MNGYKLTASDNSEGRAIETLAANHGYDITNRRCGSYYYLNPNKVLNTGNDYFAFCSSVYRHLYIEELEAILAYKDSKVKYPKVIPEEESSEKQNDADEDAAEPVVDAIESDTLPIWAKSLTRAEKISASVKRYNKAVAEAVAAHEAAHNADLLACMAEKAVEVEWENYLDAIRNAKDY